MHVTLKRLQEFEGIGNQLNQNAATSEPNRQVLPLRFVPNQNDLTSDAGDALIQFARDVKQSERNFVLEVHTDALGDASQKLTLSQNRAQYLRVLLEQLGVATSQFTVVGKGATAPIGDNRTSTGRRKNNRVQVVFEPQESSP